MALGESVYSIPVNRKVNQKAIGAQSTMKKIEKVSHFQAEFRWAHCHCALMPGIYCFIHRDNCLCGNWDLLSWKCYIVERNRVFCSRWHDHVTIPDRTVCQRSFVFSRHDLIQCYFHHLRLWGIERSSSVGNMRWHYVENVKTNKVKLLYIKFSFPNKIWSSQE